ncbi:MAG: hypothetical protein ACT4QE_14545 [Anaerolineales bacterium]
MSSETPTAVLVQHLRAIGLGDFAAGLLENVGPMGWLGAQAVHFSAPVLSLFAAPESIEAFANALEDPTEALALARALSEGLMYEGPHVSEDGHA